MLQFLSYMYLLTTTFYLDLRPSMHVMSRVAHTLLDRDSSLAGIPFASMLAINTKRNLSSQSEPPRRILSFGADSESLISECKFAEDCETQLFIAELLVLHRSCLVKEKCVFLFDSIHFIFGGNQTKILLMNLNATSWTRRTSNDGVGKPSANCRCPYSHTYRRAEPDNSPKNIHKTARNNAHT